MNQGWECRVGGYRLERCECMRAAERARASTSGRANDQYIGASVANAAHTTNTPYQTICCDSEVPCSSMTESRAADCALWLCARAECPARGGVRPYMGDSERCLAWRPLQARGYRGTNSRDASTPSGPSVDPGQRTLASRTPARTSPGPPDPSL